VRVDFGDDSQSIKNPPRGVVGRGDFWLSGMGLPQTLEHTLSRMLPPMRSPPVRFLIDASLSLTRWSVSDAKARRVRNRVDVAVSWAPHF
jgi:hypothetical protein